MRPLQENKNMEWGIAKMYWEKIIIKGEGWLEREGEERNFLTCSSLSEQSVQLYQCQVYHLQ